jgi:hypothetical protein
LDDVVGRDRAVVVRNLAGMATRAAVVGDGSREYRVHNLIGHKEYRFIFLSVAPFIIIAALGSADWIIA